MHKDASFAVPEDHPVRLLFCSLTERGMGQINIRDEESIRYVANLMVRFIRTDAMYPLEDQDGRQLEHLIDMLSLVHEADNSDFRVDQHRYVGDLTLFMLGLFPERFESKHVGSAAYWAASGRKAYRIVAELTKSKFEPLFFRKLADRFEQYVEGLNWVKLYIEDPFFQYMFREFSIS